MQAQLLSLPINPTISKTRPVLTDELIHDFTMSGRTSIFRKGASAPMKEIISKGLLTPGISLNYGKGRYNHDTDEIAKLTGHCVGYDYVHHPDVDLLGSNYKNLYSGYVVNTLKIEARDFVWCQMASCCTKGVAFIAARTDKSSIKGTAFEDGYITSIGTFQKGYDPKELVTEALQFFKYACEIKGKGGFSIVACSQLPLSDEILSHAK